MKKSFGLSVLLFFTLFFSVNVVKAETYDVYDTSNFSTSNKCSNFKKQYGNKWLITPMRNNKTSTACLYSIDIANSDKTTSCLFLQFEFYGSDNSILITSKNAGNHYTKYSVSKTGESFQNATSNYSTCPSTIYVDKDTKAKRIRISPNKGEYTLSLDDSTKANSSSQNQSSSSNSNEKNATSATVVNDDSKYESILSGEEKNNMTCEEILRGDSKNNDLIDLIQLGYNILKVSVPILLIVFGSIDFGKAVFSSDEGEMKKAQQRFMKRVIIAVAFFVVPSLLQELLNIANKIWGNIDSTFCGIKL